MKFRHSCCLPLNVQLFLHHLLKRLSFLHWIALNWCQKLGEHVYVVWASLVVSGKESACNAGDRGRRYGFDPWVRKNTWRKDMATHSSILRWKLPIHGVAKESNMTGQLNNNKRSLDSGFPFCCTGLCVFLSTDISVLILRVTNIKSIKS